MVLYEQAPAKVNLTLHVTGQDNNGYHLLDSLVVFAGICDELHVKPSNTLNLTLEGPNSQNLSTGLDNLVLKAAYTLQKHHKIDKGAQITLTKRLPFAAGIGSGSSDAAATFKVLTALWACNELAHNHPLAISLGADIPVCMAAPSPMRMRGIGDKVTPAPQLPEFAMVLINPRVDVPTQAIFKRLTNKINPPMQMLEPTRSFLTFLSWLKKQRNDLQTPAIDYASQIHDALNCLNAQPDVAWAGMSGSGATCFGLTQTLTQAQSVSRALKSIAPKHWWIEAAPCLS